MVHELWLRDRSVMMSGQMWATLGLLFDIAGAVILFFWGPLQPKMEPGSALRLSGPQYDEENTRRARQKKLLEVMSKIGLAIIAVGFVLQLVGLYVP